MTNDTGGARGLDRPRDDLSILAPYLGDDDLATLQSARPPVSGDPARDGAAFSRFWTIAEEAHARVITSAPSDPAARRAGETLRDIAEAAREAYLATHAEALYEALTDDYRKAVRLPELVEAAGRHVPGLVPPPAALAEERARPLARKHGLELAQGVLLGAFLSLPKAGNHLCNTMLMPRPESLDLLPRLIDKGAVDLGKARVRRRGEAVVVELCHPTTLNAEDDETIAPLETAVDLATLDPASRVAIFRGGPVSADSHPAGRVFCSGINLTDLYEGRIEYLFYMTRDMGLVNKIFRGVSPRVWSEVGAEPPTTEKLWIAAVETFAIGGGCQLVLVMDYVVAGDDAYFTLPARKEGIIPGLANLRLPRFIGIRLARQAILYGLRIDCGSATGRMICDRVVANEEIEPTLDAVVADMTDSGMVSASSNRKALRVNVEPLEAFRAYMAAYAPEQARCHLSPQLVDNLERFWINRPR